MENQNKKLEKFLDKKVKTNKKQIVKQPDGIIERIDKKLVTEDGRQLLRERLYEI
jgi:hypothetical protein